MSCDICLENIGDYKCSKCGCICCYECLEKIIIKDTQKCPKCEDIIPIQTIWDCLGNSKFQSTYLGNLYKNKLEYELRLRQELMPYCSMIVKYVHDKDDFTVYEKFLESIEKYNTYLPNLRKKLSDAGYSLPIYSLKDLSLLNIDKIKEITGQKDIDEVIDRYTAYSFLFGQSTSFNISKFSPEYIIRRVTKEYLTNSEEGKSNRYIFICPNEKCKGFVNENYYCDICKTQFCSKCFAPISKSKEHVCSEEDLKTMTDIKQNTKPCPNCKTRITKGLGCSEMFCTVCHIGFDWNTGRIIKGHFHNPHREEWLKSKERKTMILDFPSDVSSTNLIFGKYISQIAVIREKVHRATVNTEFIRGANEEKIVYELIKYILGWDNSFDNLILSLVIKEAKANYLNDILSNFADLVQNELERMGNMYYVLQAECGNARTAKNINRVVYYDEVKEKIPSNVKVPNAAKDHLEKYRHLFNAFLHNVHDITEHANIALEHYSEAFQCRKGMIYDDSFSEWRELDRYMVNV